MEKIYCGAGTLSQKEAEWKVQGEIFKSKRDEWGIGIRELSRHIGVSQSTVRRLECGKATKMTTILERGLDNYIAYLKKERLSAALLPLATGTPRPDDTAVCCTMCGGYYVCDVQTRYVGGDCIRRIAEKEGDLLKPELWPIIQRQVQLYGQ